MVHVGLFERRELGARCARSVGAEGTHQVVAVRRAEDVAQHTPSWSHRVRPDAPDLRTSIRHGQRQKTPVSTGGGSAAEFPSFISPNETTHCFAATNCAFIDNTFDPEDDDDASPPLAAVAEPVASFGFGAPASPRPPASFGFSAATFVFAAAACDSGERRKIVMTLSGGARGGKRGEAEGRGGWLWGKCVGARPPRPRASQKQTRTCRRRSSPRPR